MEYILPTQNMLNPPVILWVVDTCMIESEMQAVKDSLLQVMNTLPENVLIGLITFGAHCFIHELSDNPKQYAFKGTKEITTPMIIDQLGFGSRNDPRGAQAGARRFLSPMSECEYILGQIIEEIEPDPWPVPSDSRPIRCVGTAISAGLSLLEATFPGSGARLMLILGGAATCGPGMIVSEKLTDQIRTYLDIKNDVTKYTKKAAKFYETQAQKAVRTGHCIDIFCCALDQSGLLEMRNLVEKTGGYIVVHDTFEKQVFKDSFLRVFQRDTTGSFKMAFNGRMEIFLSKDVKVCGCIGPCLSEKKKSPQISDTEIGEGQTIQWFMPSLDNNTTYAFYLDVTTQPNSQIPAGRKTYIQFQTLYQHSAGRMRLRVTTQSYKYAEQNSIREFINGFDQETAAVLMARYAVLRTENEEHIDVLRWLDRMLIRLCARFAEYQREVPSSFRICKEFSLYPQFMFHLRRSQFLTTFNLSPDESTYYRSLMMRENVSNTLVMIQPALLQYSFDSAEPQPVMLDVSSLKPNTILLLDTFFYILEWYGQQITKWKEANYHHDPKYANFKALLELPKEYAKEIIEERFPVPRYMISNQGDGNERWLKSKVNFSGGSFDISAVDTSNYATDDVSLKVFMDHLIKLAVTSS